MLRINSPFVTHFITQKKMQPSLIVDNRIKKSIIVENILFVWAQMEAKKDTV